MVSLEAYRDIVQQILTEYSTHQPAYGDVEVDKGIPKQNIVLAYQSPNLRQFTEFALA